MKIPNSKRLSDYPVFFLKEMHHPQLQLHLPSHNAGSLVDSWLTIGHIDPTWWHLPGTKWRTWRKHLNLHSSSSALLQMFWIWKIASYSILTASSKCLDERLQKKIHSFQPWIRTIKHWTVKEKFAASPVLPPLGDFARPVHGVGEPVCSQHSTKLR